MRSELRSGAHIVCKAQGDDLQRDCCGDRYPCNVALVCSCGFKGCRGCMQEHILEVAAEPSQAEAKLAAVRETLSELEPATLETDDGDFEHYALEATDKWLDKLREIVK